MTRPLVAFTHDAGFAHAPPDAVPHVERPERLTAVRAGVDAWGGRVEWREAREATREELLGVHAAAHVDRVEAACARGGWIDADTYAVPASWRAALTSAGAAVQAAASAAEGVPAFAVTRPPGHHATPQRAMGFCLFSNAAIAAHALTERGLRVSSVDVEEEPGSSAGRRTATRGLRVAVVDVDVHHGNGTQDCLYERDDVLYVSLHQSPLYPGTGGVTETGRGPGEGCTLNLPVPPGTAHAGWLECFDGAVLPVVRAFEPDVILVSAGFDAHAKDPLGGLDLVAQSFFEAVARLRGITGDRIAVVLEGGYNLEALRDSATATAAALAGAESSPVEEPVRDGRRPWPDLRDALSRAFPVIRGVTPGA